MRNYFYLLSRLVCVSRAGLPNVALGLSIPAFPAELLPSDKEVVFLFAFWATVALITVLKIRLNARAPHCLQHSITLHKAVAFAIFAPIIASSKRIKIFLMGPGGVFLDFLEQQARCMEHFHVLTCLFLVACCTLYIRPHISTYNEQLYAHIRDAKRVNPRSFFHIDFYIISTPYGPLSVFLIYRVIMLCCFLAYFLLLII